MALLLVAGKHVSNKLLHVLAQRFRLNHLQVFTMRKDLAQEVVRRSDVKGEVGIIAFRFYHLLRVMQRKSAQIVGLTAPGTQDDMLQRCIVGQHTEILAKIPLWRKTRRTLQFVAGETHGLHAIQRIRFHMTTCESQ